MGRQPRKISYDLPPGGPAPRKESYDLPPGRPAREKKIMTCLLAGRLRLNRAGHNLFFTEKYDVITFRGDP